MVTLAKQIENQLIGSSAAEELVSLEAFNEETNSWKVWLDTLKLASETDDLEMNMMQDGLEDSF